MERFPASPEMVVVITNRDEERYDRASLSQSRPKSKYCFVKVAQSVGLQFDVTVDLLCEFQKLRTMEKLVKVDIDHIKCLTVNAI